MYINKKNVSVALKSELNPEDTEPTDAADSPEDETETSKDLQLRDIYSRFPTDCSHLSTITTGASNSS